MRFQAKYLVWAGIGLSWLGYVSLPKDVGAAMIWLISTENWISDHAPHPILFAFLVGLTFGIGIIPEGWALLKPHIFPKSPKPNMKINDAIDYIVNDSAENLKQPSPPQIEEGRRLIERGVEHSDALRFLNEKLANGECHAWGLREITGRVANQFETLRKPIKTDYWDIMALHPVTCFHDTEWMAQTEISPGPMGYSRYAGLMLCRDEVIRSFPKKNIPRRAWEMARRKPRITYQRPGS